MQYMILPNFRLGYLPASGITRIVAGSGKWPKGPGRIGSRTYREQAQIKNTNEIYSDPYTSSNKNEEKLRIVREKRIQ